MLISIVILRAESVCVCVWECWCECSHCWISIFGEVNDVLTTRHCRPQIGLLCQLWRTPVRRHTLFYAAPCHNAGAVNREPRSAVDDWRKRLKRALRFFHFSLIIPRGHHFNVSCRGCEFLPDPNPSPTTSTSPSSPTLSGGKSADFLCLNGLAKDNFICIWKRGEKKKNQCIFFCALFVQPIWNGCSVIVLCFLRGDLNIKSAWMRKKKIILLFGLLPCVWSETRDSHASPALLWINGFLCYDSVRKHRCFSDRGPY